jgi:hypothetical protein
MKKSLKALILFVLIHLLPYMAAGQDFARESLLRTGLWKKIKVTEEGIYRISWSKLAELGFADPSAVRIYGNNQGQLSYYNDDPRPDDLIEVALKKELGQDGIFNDGDYIYFYAQGTHRWKYNNLTGKYSFSRHNYSDTAVYFLTEMPGSAKSIASDDKVTLPASYVTEAYDALYLKEEETENIINSGREWYQPLSVLKGVAIDPDFKEIVPGEPVKYKLRVVGRSPVPVMFRILDDGETMTSVMVPEVNIFNYTGTYARYGEAEGTLPYSSESKFEIRFYNNGESSAKGWLDHLWLQGRCKLIPGDRQLIFSDSRSVGTGIINEYLISATDNTLHVWDVTNPQNPLSVQTEYDGSYIRFRAGADSLRKFVAFSHASLMSPLYSSEPVQNQNLHGIEPCDMLIIAHPWFVEHANRLASLHYEKSGLISRIVTPFEIYNEFSGGIPDVAAIRNFTRMVWMKNSSSDNPLKYLLLFGDGSYQNKLLPPANPNFVPTWQTQNSNVIVSSFMSDDFYGLLGEGEGEAQGFLDIGIGRLPASDTLSATIMVNKIEKYMNSSDPGTWRNLITLVADDEDGNLHLNDTENLASLIGTVSPSSNIEKIYFDAFRQETTVNGQSYPDASKAVNDRIGQGTLIFNYLGHGNELGLAHERVVKISDINAWKNLSKLPLFITATCEFSRFDDVEYNPINGTWTPRTSAGEITLLSPSGGAIALMSTTRVVFSAPNFILNRNIYNHAFNPDSTGEQPRLGDIIKLAKINSGAGTNKRNFSLLGDPALRLAYPFEGQVMTDSVNSRHISLPADTLKALSEITISGHIRNRKGEHAEGWSGTLTTTIFDKPITVTTLANDGGFKIDFEVMNSILFSGKSTVTNGRFTVSFIVPRDIDYNYGSGKISYYAYDESDHAAGYYNQITVGGFSPVTASDTTGPVIRLFLNDTLFRDGSVAGSEPYLYAIISDESGINTTGAGIGHDLTLWMNGNRNGSIIVNNYFEADFDNFRQGTIRYPLGNLDKGEYTTTLKAWDNYNNSSEETLVFIVGDDIRFTVTDILNYPNPFTTLTKIVAGHNRPDSEIEVEIEIFDMSGRKVRTLNSVTQSGGYAIQPIEWDRTASDGSLVSSGTYLFRVTLRTGNSEIARGSGRMIIL